MNTNIENYLILAQNAIDGKNFVECDNYVNKVLEVDAVNTDAYLLKIKSLLIKQRIEYKEDEQTIDEFEYLENIEKQKSSCYSIMVNKCNFQEKHIKSVMDFVMEDFFGDIYGYSHQNVHLKVLSTDLLTHVFRKTKGSSSDDEIIQAYLGVYNQAKNKDESTAKVFLKACSKNQKYNITSQSIAESFYRELIRIGIYEILDAFPEIEYSIKELLQNTDFMKEDSEFFDIKPDIDDIQVYIAQIKTSNPSYDIHEDELVELNKILRFWIKGQYFNHAISVYNKIKRINPSYPVDSDLENTIKSYQSPKKSGCYIATCVYGSYDCPEVWTLRRFRDFKLSESWYGRTFIRMYYSISPRLVKWFGHTKWFQKLWKIRLDKMVSELKKQGYEDTKYEDRF